MSILEQERKKFFDFIDSILKQNSTITELEDSNISKVGKKEGGVEDMADEKKLEDLEKKIKELSDSFTNDKKTLEDAHKAAIVDVEKKLSDAHAKELEATAKKLVEAEKKLSEREIDLKKEKVTKTCDDLISKGFWPSVVDKVKKVMLADVEGKFSTIKLDEKDMSVSEMLVDMLEAIPTDVRVSLEELAHTIKNTDPNKKYMSEKEVEEYAKEKKLSYGEACSELAKEGKIEL